MTFSTVVLIATIAIVLTDDPNGDSIDGTNGDPNEDLPIRMMIYQAPFKPLGRNWKHHFKTSPTSKTAQETITGLVYVRSLCYLCESGKPIGELGLQTEFKFSFNSVLDSV